MPAEKLTEAFVRNIDPGQNRIEISDAQCRGLRIRISPARDGKPSDRAWSFVFRDGGKVERVSLGKWPDLSVAAARTRADDVRVRKNKGASPAQEKRDAKAEAERLNVDDLVEMFLVEYAAAKKSARQYESFLKAFQRKFGHRDPATLRRPELTIWLDGIAAKAPVAANRTRSHVSKLFNWAIELELASINPIAGVKKRAKEEARSRVLRPKEIAALWFEAPKYITPGAHTALRLILLTAARPGEVTGMRVCELEDLDTPSPIWHLPADRVKTGKAREVPLSSVALTLIRERISFIERHGETADHIFPSRAAPWQAATSAFLPQAVATFRKRMGSKAFHFTAHDLRRSAATLASEAGLREEAIAALLGHAPTSVTKRVYIRNTFASEMRQAVEAIEAAIVKACV